MERDMFRFYKSALSGEITTPLCAEYKSAWRQCGDDKEMLVRLVMKEQSLPFFFAHCYQNKGLSKEYILSEFSDYINGKYVGIDVDGVIGNYKTELYVGYNDNLSVSDDVLATMWSTIPSMEIPTCKAVKIYCACGSEVHLSCDGYNSVIVMLFDDSKIILDDVDEDSNITIYKYSDKASVELGKFCLKEPKVFNKELRL